MAYKLSIVIPTKNRQKYALKAVEQIYSITSTTTQIVIQDNSDKPSLEEEIKNLGYSNRVKYSFTKDIISSMENYNIGISLAEGYYVCCIGDDDGVMPEIDHIVDWAIENNIDAVNQADFSQYWWPNSRGQKAKSDDGEVLLKIPQGNIKIYNPQTELLKMIKNPLVLFTSVQTVKVYHGIVKKEILNHVKDITSYYVGGLSADIYPATACSLLVNKVYVIDFPFVISGVCRQSTASDSLRGKHIGNFKDAPQLIGVKEYYWVEEISKFYSVETIWAESMIHAIKDMKREKILKEFSVAKHAICCLWRHYEYKDEIINNLKKNKVSIFKIMFALFSLGSVSIINRLKNIVKSILKPNTERLSANNIVDIIEAQKFISSEIQKRHIKINFSNIEV